MKVIMKKQLLNCIAGAVVACSPLFAQKNNDYYRQQQQANQTREMQDQQRRQLSGAQRAQREGRPAPRYRAATRAR